MASQRNIHDDGAKASSLLEAAARSAPVGIAVVDAADAGLPVLAANTAFARLTGREDIAGRRLAELFDPAPPPDFASIAIALAAGRPSAQRLRVDGQGGGRWLELEASPLGGQEGRAVVVASDVTAQQRHEEALAAARDEAERAIAAKMRFFAAASHDLRQPIQALALFVTALEGQIERPEGQAAIQAMKTSLKIVEQMFEGLLDVSRIDAGVLKPEPTSFLVSDVLEELEQEFAPQAATAGLELRVAPSSEAVHSDPGLLARILRNFLANAIRYTARGRVLIGCRRRGRSLRIEVWDTGPGIPETRKPEIFREFYQGGTECPHESAGRGLGLGLAIVQRLARLLHHPLDLRSVEGKGSMFAVQVPRAELTKTPPQGLDAPKRPDVSGAVVVVVDDDPEILAGLRMLIEEWGGRAVAAVGAEDALAEIDRDGLDPDLVLADLSTGGGEGGLDAIRRIRERTDADLPAFLFTGETGEGEMEFPILRKPLNPDRLRDVVAAALARRG